MDNSPMSIVVQQQLQPWKPEIIIEESEEDVQAFIENKLPASAVAKIKPRFDSTRLQVPGQIYGRRRLKRQQQLQRQQQKQLQHQLQIEHRLQQQPQQQPQPKPQKKEKKKKKHKRRRRRSSVGKVARTLGFVAIWSKKRRRFLRKSNPARDAFLNKFRSSAPSTPGPSTPIVVRPSFSPDMDKNINGSWIRKYLPLNPTSPVLYWWLLLVSCFVLYNCFMIIARETYDQLNEGVLGFWLFLDYMSDAVYLIDMVMHFITSHVGEHGLLEKDFKKLAIYYVKSRNFWVDTVSILPTDIFYLVPTFGLGRVSIRLNRLFRLHRMIQFFHWTESQTNYPNVVRVCILIVYITLIIHWNACIYFLISEAVGFGNDTWVYPALIDDEGNATIYATLTRQYLFSFYWSTLTLTTIGELPGPRTDWEFVFVILDFMVGVLIFATVVGMVGGIITNMNVRRMEFQQRLDDIKHYMRYRSVGKPLQRRVIKWFDYLWNNNHSLDEEEILQSLPDKLKAEIAIHVHFETLRRVKIFDDCEAGLLEELVLKLQPQVYSPGDYICRKGDIGKEMYIIKHGRLEVVADDGETILAVLTDGGYFGEISILNLSGYGNRRTANVRSVGYSELFCLSKTDLLEALTEYPEAREALEDRGRQTLMNDSTLTKHELMSLSTFKKKKPKASSETVAGLKNKLEDMEKNMKEMNDRFVSLIGEYSTVQLKLRRKVRGLEAKLKSPKSSSKTPKK